MIFLFFFRRKEVTINKVTDFLFSSSQAFLLVNFVKSLYFHKIQRSRTSHRRYSIFQNSQGNTCVEAYFLVKLQAEGLQLKVCFPASFANFLETPILWDVYERLLLTFWLKTLVTSRVKIKRNNLIGCFPRNQRNHLAIFLSWTG